MRSPHAGALVHPGHLPCQSPRAALDSQALSGVIDLIHEAALSRVPLGMVVPQANGTFLSMNRAMVSIALGAASLRLAGRVLSARPRADWAAACARAFAGDGTDATMNLIGAEAPAMLWLSPLRRGPHQRGAPWLRQFGPPARSPHRRLAGFPHGPDELAQVLMLGCGDWGLNAVAIQAPVHIWHGDADPLVAPEGARQLVARLPAALLTLVPGAGHVLLYSHWCQILGGGAAGAIAAAPAR